MSKRRAGTELTRDNWDEEEEKVEIGVFKIADESTLKNRVLKKAKRTLQRDESGEMKPIFSGFSGFNNVAQNSNSKQAFSFLSKCNETFSESGNHPSASTINSMTTSTSSTFSENNCSKGTTPSVVNHVKVMKLNEAFVKFVTNAVQKNPYCVLTPTLKDYEKQVNKFVTITDCKTNTSNSAMDSSKESPQVSSFENTVVNIKNAEEVKNNAVNVQTNSKSFDNPLSNTLNTGKLFKFGNSSPVTNTNESNLSNTNNDKTNEETKEEKNVETKSQSVSLEESKSTPTSGFKLGDYNFKQQSISTSLTKNSSDFSLNDKKISPLSKSPEIKFNTAPSFNFQTSVSPSFSFGKPTEENKKFSFGKPSEENNKFSFGKPSEENSKFSFGKPTEDNNTFSFGKPSEENNKFSFGKPTGENNKFSFGKPPEQNDNKPFFSFGSKLSSVTPNAEPSKNTEDQQSKDEEDEDQPPVVNFTPIKENDAIFESKSKLFCLKNGKYEEHGIGQLYLKPVDDKKIQLLMRNDNALGTIMVNTLLNETVNFTKRNAKNVQLICVLDPTKSTKPQTVLFKFKDSQITDAFESELNKLKK